MQIGVRVSVRSRGSVDAWIKSVERATRAPRKVDVGLVAGQAPRDVVMYGIYNHEGTSRGIPSRPFVKVAFFQYQGAARGIIRTGLRGAARGQASFSVSARTFGAAGVGWVRGIIDSSLGPPLAASTIARKGSAQTLIQTGKMRASISFKVR